MNNTLESRNSNDRVGYLDAYRGLACLLVYFYHTAVNVSFFGVAFPGYYGVHLFFVLSGYLMSGKFIQVFSEGGSLPNLRKYLKRRLLRIYPPYLVCLAVFVILRIVSKTNPIEWQNVLLHAALLFNYADRQDYYSINAVFWSLAVEAQFYLVLPIAVWMALRLLPSGDKRMIWFALSFIVIGVASRIFEFKFIDHNNSHAIAHVRFKWVTSHLDLFGFGILLRAIEWKAMTKNLRLSSKLALVGVLLAIVVLSTVALWSRKEGLWQTSNNLWFVSFCSPLACIGFAVLLVSTSLSPLKEIGLLRWKWLQWIGLISYSLYLYHVGVLFAFNKIFKPLSWGMSWGNMTLLTGLICLPVTIFVAWVAYNLFEKPFLKVG